MNKQILKERKTKNQKGITLIALIITIVVLLILAVVTIRAVQGDGIIEHAKNATQRYSKAQISESIETLKYQALLDSNGASSALTLDQINAQEWITNGSASAVQDEATGDITITIPTTGETVETIIVPGKITSSADSIVGKYYGIGSTDVYLELGENGEFNATIDSFPGSGTYTYEKTTGIVALTPDGETESIGFNYSTLENNKVIHYIYTAYDSSTDEESGKEGYIFTTNGTEGFELPSDGKYIDESSKYEVTISNGIMDITFNRRIF